VLIVALLGVAFYLGRTDADLWFGSIRIVRPTLHPLTLIYVLSGSAMISATLRVPKP
jgi:CDP-diacylglycerol--serine O-phosphatidyltransferase